MASQEEVENPPTKFLTNGETVDIRRYEKLVGSLAFFHFHPRSKETRVGVFQCGEPELTLVKQQGLLFISSFFLHSSLVKVLSHIDDSTNIAIRKVSV